MDSISIIAKISRASISIYFKTIRDSIRPKSFCGDSIRMQPYKRPFVRSDITLERLLHKARHNCLQIAHAYIIMTCVLPNKCFLLTAPRSPMRGITAVDQRCPASSQQSVRILARRDVLAENLYRLVF